MVPHSPATAAGGSAGPGAVAGEAVTPGGMSAEAPGHEVLAVVLQVRDGVLHTLVWRHALGPQAGRWALPGGRLHAEEDLDTSIRRQLAEKVDVRDLSHLEQLESLGDPDRVPGQRVVATTYLGLVPSDAEPALPADTAWHPVDALPTLAYDHARIVAAGRRRLRSKLSYTNLGFALVPPVFVLSELAEHYRAALGHDVDATNLHRVLTRRGQIVATGERAPAGRSGGRPAALYRFRRLALEVTDAFAVLHPPR